MSSIGQRLLTSLAPRLGYAYIRLLGATMRLEYRNRERLVRAAEESGGYLLLFWHSRFVMMTYGWVGERLVTLSSRHRDSLMLAQITRRFGVEQAWGSSTRGGTAGMRDLLRRIKSGAHAAITPDGPKGPRRRVQPGAIAAARLSGRPIVPAAYSARPSRRLRTWDMTLLPYPFARGVYLYGEPIQIPRGADEAEQERFRLHAEQELDRLTDEADRAIGIPVEPPRTEQGT